MKKQIGSIPIWITVGFCLLMIAFFLVQWAVSPGITVSQPVQAQDTALPSSMSEPVYPIDINTATARELAFLPGVGSAVAGRIVEYRQEKGPFRSPEELTAVSGIGPAVLEKMLPYITLGG